MTPRSEPTRVVSVRLTKAQEDALALIVKRDDEVRKTSASDLRAVVDHVIRTGQRVILR